MRRGRQYAVFGTLLLLALASPLAAWASSGSYALFYGARQGLRAGEIQALAQDGIGFIWVGARGGLFRFDGDHFLHVAQQQVPRGVRGLWWNAQTGLVIQTEDHRALVEKAGAVQALAGPNGKPVSALLTAVFDGKGQLWAIIGGALWRRNASSRWIRIPAHDYGREQPLRLCSLARGVALITDRGAWHFDPAGRARLLLHAPNLFAAAGGGEHPLWLVSGADGSLWEQEGNRFRVVRHIASRVMDMRYKGNTLWVAVDRYLLAIAPDGSASTLDRSHGLPSGGPLLVDREGSLWVGTFIGLEQYPEPETRHWSGFDGLPWPHSYSVTTAAGEVWVDTWHGPVRFDTRGKYPVMFRAPLAKGRSCADRDNRVWQAVAGHLGYWRNGRYVSIPTPANAQLGLGDCAPALDGGEWLATNFGVFHVNAGDDRLQRVLPAGMPGTAPLGNRVWQGSDGSLWTATRDRLCRYRVTGLRAHRLWCGEEPFEDGVRGTVEVAPGRYWIATKAGLFSFDGQNARLLKGNAASPGKRFRAIEPAPSGGWWAVGAGSIERITPCGDCAAGFRVLETIGGWQGVPADGAKDMLELPSGDLWIAGNRDVYHVPARARSGPRSPPRVVLVSSSVDGHTLPPDQALHMRPGQKQLSLTFAALTFRDRSRLRYRFRNQADDDWSAPTVNPSLQLIELLPGKYLIEAEASLDGIHWSPSARYGFSVAPPWYRSWWARFALAVLILAIAAAIVRLWLEYKLRLERQRVRIAMDLHDELGSTLGAIGMLAGAVASDSACGERERRRLAAKIGDTSARLGSALRTVVWTMRQPETGLRQLLIEIGDQANLLFPDEGTTIRIVGDLDWDDVPVAPEVCRHVLMVVLEALHNVAQHAHASEVTVQLHKLAGEAWRITVRDDGDGFDSDAVCSGNGLASMHRRASLIGGWLDLSSTPGAGTELSLEFHSCPGKTAARFTRMIMRWRFVRRGGKMET